MAFTEIRSIRRHTPTLGWQYIIVVLSSGVMMQIFSITMRVIMPINLVTIMSCLLHLTSIFLFYFKLNLNIVASTCCICLCSCLTPIMIFFVTLELKRQVYISSLQFLFPAKRFLPFHNQK